MKITNRHNLPEPIFNAVRGQQQAYKDSHTQPYDISVTELISPPQMAVLKREHDHELEEDISEMAYSLLGTAIHSVLEDGALDTDVIEQRFNKEVDGWVVSGQVDRYDPLTGELQDYKVMSVWEHILGLSDEKVMQLNVLRYLMECEPKQLQIVALYRDWQKSKASREANYPPLPIETIEVDVLPLTQVEDYICERIRAHKAARAGEQVLCTDAERWYTGTKYAVMKTGRKSAVKLCDDHRQAFAMTQDNSAMYVEKRPGLSRRCADYCPVGKDTDICKQWLAEQEEVK